MSRGLLYSQEMQHARRFQGLHRIQGNDTQYPEDNSGGNDSRGLISPSFELVSFGSRESPSSPFGQGVESPGNGAGTPTSNFFPTALAFQEIASGIGGARVASPKMARMMSGSDYYEVNYPYEQFMLSSFRFDPSLISMKFLHRLTWIVLLLLSPNCASWIELNNWRKN